MGASQAAAPSGFKVTGGGQIIAEDAQGAGDTVGFNAGQRRGKRGIDEPVPAVAPEIVKNRR